MKTWIVLLRGINVGGTNSLPMATLRVLLENLGCDRVETYIQSGNAVVRSSLGARAIEEGLRDSVMAECGFAPRVLVLASDVFSQIAARNPFVEEASDPRRLHIWFLAEPGACIDPGKLEELRGDDERVAVHPAAVYLWAPSGIGRSKLAARMESVTGCAMTARNGRTVSRLVQIAAG